MSFVSIDLSADMAPYEQVRTQIAALVATGALEPGEKLPTVRQLAADLRLAANTVARSYRELEADGVISTRGRRGTFVRSELLEGGIARSDEVEAAAAAFVSGARVLGLSLDESTRILEAAWAKTTKSPSS